MHQAIFLARFLNTSLAVIKAVILEMASGLDIRENVGMFGHEMTVKSDRFELYVHADDCSKGSGLEYLGSGEYFGSMDELQEFVEHLARLFTSKGIVYDFEIYEENEDGEQLGDSKTIRHPDF